MLLSKSDNNTDNTITIHDITLHASQPINVPGIELDHYLKCNCHIDEMCGQIGK